MPKLIPAILTQNAEDAKQKIKLLESIPEISDVQIDFADGVFVPNRTILPKDLAGFKTPLQIEAHMMVNHPEQYFADLEKIGVKYVIVHYESFSQIQDLLVTIGNLRTLGLRAGISINPETGTEVFDKFLNQIDLILLMSVHPGFQGGHFLPETFDRLQELRKKHKDAIIEVDGGVSLQNFESLILHGANRLTVGSSIWQALDPKQTIYKFLEKIKN